ncbi:MAG: tetratricopeptide repeat protein [Acidobacteriota bacterium]
MSRAPETVDSSRSGYVDAFRTVFDLHAKGHSFSGRERHCAFLNTGRSESPRFANVSSVSGLDLIDDGRGLAAVDWDHDGDLDLWTTNRTAPRVRFLRNDLPPGSHTLQLKLQGAKVNRDAIGARATLVGIAPSGERITWLRTVRAGEGFLSQSSRWLHFGLGEIERIESLVITWPGGKREEISGIEVDARYLIVEGSKRAQPAVPVSRVPVPPQLAEDAAAVSPVSAPPARTPRRAVLAGRVPLPQLEYRDFAGQPRRLRREIRQPTLINLWASWCLACDGELRELTERAEDLAAAGLDVVALSVDGLDPEAATGSEDARRFWRRLDPPFTVGFAQRELLTKLQWVHDRLFSRQIPFAVPSSFLIDAQRDLAVFYRGPVSTEELLADVRRLEARAEARRRLATPFAGRWLAPPQGVRLTGLAQRFWDEGYVEDALVYLDRAVAEQPRDASLWTSLGRVLVETGRLDGAEDAYRQALRLDPEGVDAAKNLADLYMARGRPSDALALYLRAAEQGHNVELLYNLANALAADGQLDDARSRYRQALEIQPDYAAAYNNLGALELRAGDTEAARRSFERALELDPKLGDAAANLGLMAAAAGRLEEAGDRLRRALAIAPESAPIRNNLGVVLLRQGRTGEAAEQFEKAVALDPDYADARSNLELVRSQGQLEH